jgi:pyrroloquinoline quinone biosynthesis protein E
VTPRPYTLVAELTYRCPLRCPYCSNPVAEERGAELDTATWRKVIDDAAELGVLQIHFTGGEPLARDDLEDLVETARKAGLYSNLITSGVPLAQRRLEALAKAGLDNVQVSVQAPEAVANDAIAGYPSYARKLEVAAWVKELGLPLTINCVLHLANVDKVEEIVSLAERLGADRLELANVQLLGWALENRATLLCDKAAVDRAFLAARAAKERLKGKMEIVFVLPDYVAGRPRACMDGWAQRYMVVDPQGFVLPCHAARSIPALRFERVGPRTLAEIWTDSPALVRFRGDDWMPEPCRSCDQKHVDFGGCRCQAFALTGDATRTDPACALAPDHAIVAQAVAEAGQARERRYVYRGFPRAKGATGSTRPKTS